MNQFVTTVCMDAEVHAVPNSNSFFQLLSRCHFVRREDLVAEKELTDMTVVAAVEKRNQELS